MKVGNNNSQVRIATPPQVVHPSRLGPKESVKAMASYASVCWVESMQAPWINCFGPGGFGFCMRLPQPAKYWPVAI